MSLRGKTSSLEKKRRSLRSEKKRYQQIELKSSHSQKLSQRTDTLLVNRRSPGARKTGYLFPRKKRQSIVNVSRILFKGVYFKSLKKFMERNGISCPQINVSQEKAFNEKRITTDSSRLNF